MVLKNMRVPLIAGNWKMHATLDEAIKLVSYMRIELDKTESVEKVICPPFIFLVPLKDLVKGSSIRLGAQNMYFEEKGAFTGEISPAMLAELCQYVILGHSERRKYFGEANGLINNKVKAAFRFGLIPILCVGERLEENEAGKTEEVINQQITSAFVDIFPSTSMVIAYEPVWAIGTGKAATVEQARSTITFIRSIVASLWDVNIAQKIRILYGGSVTQENISQFMAQVEIDGALVGGASLKGEEFVSITKQTSLIKNRIKS